MSDTSDDLLNKIEALETRSLMWGFVDGSISEGEIIDIAVGVCCDEDNAKRTINTLLERRLLHEVSSSDATVRFRSRYAETVRLLAHLRQLFPNRPWFAAPSLVSDFRIDRRPRRFPRRDIAPEAALTEFAGKNMILQPIQVAAWEALTSRMGLAAFQVRATLQVLGGQGSTGTIVTAGTGSGKTLAFYLPTLLRLVPHIDRASYWTKAIAIYPRNELLKDQFAEAYRLSRLLERPLAEAFKRPVLIGALFGSTPHNAADVARKWQERRIPPYGRICPLMRCPTCDDELVWRVEDIKEGRECLVCSSLTCETVIPREHIVLTRDRLCETPPDILFTTNEMINQRLSDVRIRRVFGVGATARTKPLMVLLDEVHTYVGTSGAQAALTIRRFRHALGVDVPFVGLSATLSEASRFFGDLVGLPAEAVTEVAPRVAEMLQEGAEYQVLLRGDPSSQTSLLSTSIQTAMLLGRIMDPSRGGYSEGRFGERVFLFTDDLDVTNRLFDDLRDAEARNMYGREDHGRAPLAALRGEGNPADAMARELDGQRWRICEEIGRPLTTRLRVTRTTSQDVGVSAESDVIVATAALEVGYNDSGVGAVLQHKAPRNAASFLQRKGRAGRPQIMRPITVTVLSDYGRDRLAFQAFEHLFDPALPPQYLPVKNDYVLRIQAVYCLIDWLASRLPSGIRTAWLWDSLSRPRQPRSPESEACRECLEALLSGDSGTLDDLRRWLQGSLGVDTKTIDAIFWEPPRALILEAVPTLLRRMLRGWRLADGSGSDIRVDWHPLPDFVPRTLFGDLNLPEVQVALPPPTVRDQEKIESVPLSKALEQLPPGRVTRRFAHERGRLSHWFPIHRDLPEQTLLITEYCQEAQPLGYFRAARPIAVYRPWRINLSQARPNEALPSSNAAFAWQSELLPRGEALAVEVPSRSVWRTVISQVKFHIHQFRSSILVRRFASEVNAELRLTSGSQHVHIELRGADGAEAAVGYEFEADGFFVDVAIPSGKELAGVTLPTHLLASCRAAYFRHSVVADTILPIEANSFHREWLCQIVVSAAVARAARLNEALGVAALAVTKDSETLDRVMTAIFASQDPALAVAEDDEDGAEAEAEAEAFPGAARISRLQQTLTGLLAQEEVRKRLGELAAGIDVPSGDQWDKWLHETILETLGEALLQACISTAPRHAATDALLLDIQQGEDGQTRLWVTETTLGGAGVVQAFAESFSREPRALFRAIEAALAPTDLEIAADGLEQFLRLVTHDVGLARAVAQLRGTLGHSEREQRRKEVWGMLADRGLDIPRALAVSLDARFLRPGSGPELDELLSNILSLWDRLEQRFCFTIGPREMSYIAMFDPEVVESTRRLLGSVMPAAPPQGYNVASVIAGLLWPRGIEVRQRSLQSYSRFRRRRVTDPALVRFFLLDERVPEISVIDSQWREQFSKVLSEYGAVRLFADSGEPERLRRALVEALAVAVEVGFLRFFPTIERVVRDSGRIVATLTLRECV